MRFADSIAETVGKTEVEYGLDIALKSFRHICRQYVPFGSRVIFIGNGGSSAIASHMAIDWTKNGGIRAIAFNDAPTLTCLGNDFGYENVFSKQLEYYSTPKDVVVIISSSGKSPNILNAADEALKLGLYLVTFTGKQPDNELRKKGHMNFYVPHEDYGVVEIAHLILLHSVVSDN